MTKTKNKITTIQNQSHYIRKFLLLSAIVSYPRWHHGDQGTHNIRSQKDPIHRRMSRWYSLVQDSNTLSMGQGKRGPWKIYCDPNSSISEVGIFKAACDIWRPQFPAVVAPSHECAEHTTIFFLLYHPICQLQLNHDLPSSWVGREVQWYHTAGAVMLKRHSLEVLIQLQPRAEAQSYQKA